MSWDDFWPTAWGGEQIRSWMDSPVLDLLKLGSKDELSLLCNSIINITCSLAQREIPEMKCHYLISYC